MFLREFKSGDKVVLVIMNKDGLICEFEKK